MFRNVRGLFLAMAIVMLFTVTASATKPTLLVSIRVDEEPIKCFYTKTSTVDEFLGEQEIYLNSGDKLSHPSNDPLEHNMTLELQRRMLVHLVIDGEIKPHYTTTKDVANLVAEVKREHNELYAYDNELWNEKVTDQYVLALSTAKVETEIVKTQIPYETTINHDDSVAKGLSEIMQTGIFGELTSHTDVHYLGGEEIKRELVEETITIHPQNEIIKEGTAEIISESAPYQYTERYTMNASAYTADYNSTGKNPGDRGFGITASGMKARVGVVAVDPKVIPLGTELYIEGYGKAIAGDTGGAIKGHKIDLYFDSNTECRQFGRRNIEVWVLK